jgi:esterase/lipase superfamily enzyme
MWNRSHRRSGLPIALKPGCTPKVIWWSGNDRLCPPLAAIWRQAGHGGAVQCVGYWREAARVIVRHVCRPTLSRRALLRGLGAAGCASALSGCAGMAAPGEIFDASDIAVNATVLVATNRKPVRGAQAKPWFGTERASAITFARAKLTPPDGGRFSLASVGLADWQLNEVEAVAQFGELFPPERSGRDLLMYVPGFNQTFEMVALDAARLSDGIKFHGSTMVFSWPSKANLLDYGYDRESAMWSRDALERVLEQLIGSSDIGRTHIVAHSIGTMLTLEGLRLLYAQQSAASIERIGSVVFAAPDIDIDVFSSSVQRIGPLASKITVVTATNDRALAISSLIAGGITRVGSAEKARLEGLGLRVIDASQQGWGIINHDLFLSNARIRQVIRNAIDGHPMGA